MFVFFSVSCYLSWSCYFALIVHFFNSLFFKYFLKVFDFKFLIIGRWKTLWSLLKLMSAASLVSMLFGKITANEDVYHSWYFYGILLFQLSNLYVLQVNLRKPSFSILYYVNFMLSWQSFNLIDFIDLIDIQ